VVTRYIAFSWKIATSLRGPSMGRLAAVLRLAYMKPPTLAFSPRNSQRVFEKV
jgi:hypothetical protein